MLDFFYVSFSAYYTWLVGNCSTGWNGKNAYNISRPVRVADAGKPAQYPSLPCPIAQEGYLGCWHDSPIKTLEFKAPGGAIYTVDSCRRLIATNFSSYVVFGMQYGGECWASSSPVNYTLNGPADFMCNVPCNADTDLFCGAGNVNQVYSVADRTPAKGGCRATYMQPHFKF